MGGLYGAVRLLAGGFGSEAGVGSSASVSASVNVGMGGSGTVSVSASSRLNSSTNKVVTE
jgi:hypothetical protein